MSVSVLVNKLTLCHRGDGGGTVTATVPDVCKTPPNAVPVPFPNIARAADLTGGTTTVFVDGNNMAAHSASRFAKSSGDEPGTLGGVVSGVNMGDASWISYSMDVFLEGLNACRLTDKMLLNHGNTVSMGGFLTDWLKAWLKKAIGGDVDCDALVELIKQILNGNKGIGSSWAPDARGLKERFYQQIFGKIAPGDPGWAEHDKAIEDLQDQLRDYLKKYDQFCKGGPPIPDDAWEWATKDRPNENTYKGPPSSSFDWGMAAACVLGALAIGVMVAQPETIPFFAAAGAKMAGAR